MWWVLNSLPIIVDLVVHTMDHVINTSQFGFCAQNFIRYLRSIRILRTIEVGGCIDKCHNTFTVHSMFNLRLQLQFECFVSRARSAARHCTRHLTVAIDVTNQNGFESIRNTNACAIAISIAIACMNSFSVLNSIKISVRSLAINKRFFLPVIFFFIIWLLLLLLLLLVYFFYIRRYFRNSDYKIIKSVYYCTKTRVIWLNKTKKKTSAYTPTHHKIHICIEIIKL